ncbi:hypothetical protein LSH36_74g10031 [Paralvinella palmiformis]|uniref:EGF-like domain-containing protein n=1 Tax=Paralvinella palmiformis TaxID=53620 RepID=A0AAD9NCR8_9ANNE|nr:hypothetical protein LSH36_74g10031 [Paralvinella palmiformis]
MAKHWLLAASGRWRFQTGQFEWDLHRDFEKVAFRADLFFVATSEFIRYFNMSDPDDPGSYIPLENLHTPVAIDYDPVEDYVYWTDVGRKTISRARSNGDGQQVLHNGVVSADGLTLDLDSRMMYWTSSGNDTIERSTLDGNDRKILINTEIEEPRAILLHKQQNKMYWTDWGPSIRRIQRANLDGSDREVLVNTTLMNPFGLALDIPRQRMYWAEAWLDNFESSALDGDDRQLIYHEDGVNPFSIALRDILLVGDIHEIRQVNLDVEKHLGEVISATLKDPVPLAIDYDPNKDIIYWCDILSKSIRSVHRDGSGLSSNDNKPFWKYVKAKRQDSVGLASIIDKGTLHTSSQAMAGILNEQFKSVFTKGGDTTNIPALEAGQYPDIPRLSIDVHGTHKLLNQSLGPGRAAQRGTQRIWAIGELALVTENVTYPASLALSWETNELFWADSEIRVIEKLDLSTNKRTIIIHTTLLTPRGIALHKSNKTVYWTDATLGWIQRASYDGEDRETVIGGLETPTAIVLDIENDFMYWNEYGASKIMIASLNGKNARKLASPINSLSMTILGSYIYWTDNNKNFTGRANRYTGKDFSVVLMRERFMGIRILEGIIDCSHSPCINGGSCTDNINGHTCQCVEGFTGKNCQTDIDDCGSDPCQNRGTCVDQINEYVCICGPKFTGKHCEKVMNPCTSSPCWHNGVCGVTDNKIVCSCRDGWFGDICQFDSLMIDTISPQVGPVAGGTNITISGIYFPSSGAQVTIGSIARCRTLSSNITTIIAMTPSVNGIHSEKENQISISFPGRKLDFSTSYIFVYKANPSVTSVYPLETINRGGTRLTVTGNNFDAVEKPVLKVDKVDQMVSVSGTSVSVINETIVTYYEDCTSATKIKLICITPDIDISDTMIFTDDSISGERKRRDLTDQQVRVRQKREVRIEIRHRLYIGIILDGVGKFENLSANVDTRNYGRLSVTSTPEFHGSSEDEVFKFTSGQPIGIKGKNIDRLSREDYRVDISSGQCQILEITDNKLQCMPPQKEPPKDKRSSSKGHLILVCSKHFAASLVCRAIRDAYLNTFRKPEQFPEGTPNLSNYPTIHVGTRIKEPVGYLKYPFQMILYIGIGVSSVVVIIAMIVIVVICVRRKSAKRRSNEERQQIGDGRDVSAIELPPVDARSVMGFSAFNTSI